MPTDELRQLAEAATPGPWLPTALPLGDGARSFGNYVVTGLGSGYPGALLEGMRSGADAAYIAAASPDRILALLDERDRLTAALTDSEKENEPLACDEPGCPRYYSVGTPRIYGLGRANGGEYRNTCHHHIPAGWPEGRALSDGTIIRPFRSGPEAALLPDTKETT